MTDPVRSDLAVRHSSSLLLKYAAYVQIHVFTWLQITKKPPSLPEPPTHHPRVLFHPRIIHDHHVIILHVARIRLIVNCYSTLQYSVLLQTLFAIKQSIRYFYILQGCANSNFSVAIYGFQHSF